MRKFRIFCGVCSLLWVWFMAGCASDDAGVDVADGNQETAEDTRVVFTADEFLADYDRLWEILEEDYIYFPILESRGVCAASLQETTRQQLRDRITDLDGFYYLLNSMFGKMQYFAHLSVVSPEIFEAYVKYYNEENTQGSAWKVALQNSQTQAVYEALRGTAAAADPGESSLREVEASYDAQRKAVTFGITTFDGSLIERDRNFISNYLTSLGDVEIEHIIFDISGNGGGSDLYWQENIVAPFGGTYEWPVWWYLRDTELTRSYFFGDLAPEPMEAISDHELPEFVQELGLTHFIKFQRQLSGDAVLKENVRAAKRWVIIDSRVYSSADSFSAFCKATGWAVLVGQPTLGDGEGTSPVLAVLPNTGLLVRFSGAAAETCEGNLNADAGTEPDVRVRLSEESAREAVARLIDEEAF